jgi:hypothetical protein
MNVRSKYCLFSSVLIAMIDRSSEPHSQLAFALCCNKCSVFPATYVEMSLGLLFFIEQLIKKDTSVMFLSYLVFLWIHVMYS